MVFVSGGGGCLLPLLTVLNLFFGRLIFSPRDWFLVGIALILMLILSLRWGAARSYVTPKKRKGVIDVEGKVVEEKRKISM